LIGEVSKAKARKAEIRQMDIDDIAAVYHLGEELFTSEDLPILYRTWDPFEVAEYFSSDPEYCLVAEVDERIVGFVLANSITKEGTAWKKYGYLAWIGVDEDFQGMNLGRRLYREVERRLQADGVRMVIADTEGGNEEAIAFFARSGFTPRREHIWLAKTLRRSAKKTDRKKSDGKKR